MTELEDKVTRESELIELGFDAAAQKIATDRALARKLRIAFEHFRVVEPDKIERFNTELYRRTLTIGKYGGETWDRLVFTPVNRYPGVPPTEVLQKIREAKKLECFDSFEVATIEAQVKRPDPIVFGVINGSTNKYFVAQWDDDVKIEDILKEDEG